MAPIHYAAETNSKEMLELLISKGANINIKDLNFLNRQHYKTFSLNMYFNYHRKVQSIADYCFLVNNSILAKALLVHFP